MADNLIPVFYGLAVLSALAIAVASGRALLMQLGAILFIAWFGCNAIVISHGHQHAPMLIPTFDAILALCVGALAVFNENRTAAVVFGLFVLVEIVHVVAFEIHTQGTPFYFLTLNMLFLAQVVTVGGSSVASLIADSRRPYAGGVAGWLHRSGLFARPPAVRR